MIKSIIDFCTQHEAVIVGGATAVVHFSHLAWPRLVAMFPYCRDNGGAIGILNQFLYGRQVAAAASSPGASPELKAPTESSPPIKT